MSHKLLLADDSITIQRVIELTFADEDVQVAVVGDGKQAIERIQTDRPDIVLADIGMPERDGYEVAGFVKGNPQFAHIPVVLLTGAFEPIDEDRARSVGCDDVLVKPFEPQMVINRVRELLSRRPPVPPPAPPPSSRPVDLDSNLAPLPSLHQTKAAQGDSLEDYFDRLDAAFATIGTAPVPGPGDLRAGLGDLHQPSHERAPSGGDPLTSWDPDLAGDFAPARQPHLANAFAALLAAEQGHTLPHTPMPSAISEETIEEIVRRVIDRMADESMRRLVLETAERLVREEIDRIKRS